MSGRGPDVAGRILDGHRLGREELLSVAGEVCADPIAVIRQAWAVRHARFGNRVTLCSIVAGKLGGCTEDCAFCAQSARQGGAGTKPARTPAGEIVAAAAGARNCGAARIGIVNSGRRPAEGDLEAVLAAGRAMGAATAAADRRDGEGCPSRAGPGLGGQQDAATRRIGLCASLGEVTKVQAHALVAAGFTRYNHNLETSRRLYGRIVTTHTYDDRLRTLAACRSAGMELCCGGIFGIGETWADRIDLALTLRDEVHPAVTPLNFLHPIPGTPMGANKPLAPMECLAIIAVFRLAMPDVDLKIAGGREVCLRDLQSWMFHAGGTSTMVGNYLTTCGRPAEEDLRMIQDLGMELVDKL